MSSCVDLSGFILKFFFFSGSSSIICNSHIFILLDDHFTTWFPAQIRTSGLK